MSHVVDVLTARNDNFILTSETYYIPESWYLQIFTEGGLVGGVLFVLILVLILWKIRKHPYIFAATAGVFAMNLVLHTFESVHSSLIWAALVGAILA